MRAAVGVVVGLGMGVVACSALIDTSGLVGPVEVLAEGGANDAMPAMDDGGDVILSGADAGLSDAADTGTGFCATAAPPNIFCDDFDESPFGTGWTSTSGGAGVFLDTTQFISTPQSLRMLHAADAGMTTFVMVKSVPFPTGKILRLSFDYRPEQIQNDHIAGFSGTDTSGIDWRVEFDPGILIAYFATTTTANVTLGPEPDVWHRFAIELDHTAPGATFSVIRDGVAAGSIALPATALPATTMTTIGVTLGPSSLKAGESWMSWQDNVVVEVL